MRPISMCFCLTSALFAVSSASSARAGQYPNGGVTGSEMAADLQSAGLKVTETKDPTGDPKLRVSIPVKDGEVPYVVFFFDCKDARCATIEYHASFNGNADKIPHWNKDYRFGRAYFANDKVNVEYDVDVEKGANSEGIRNSADRFAAVLIESIKFMGTY